MKNNNFYIGLDIGTDSIGYAVTDLQYNIEKFKGEPMWGVHLFDTANLCDKRRVFRTARRRLDRRQQRIKLLQELFAKEIAEIDDKFFIRIQESALYPEDTSNGSCLFNDKTFTDKEYYRLYPTIHHLIYELIKNPQPHDVRLVYIACAWLVAHRGHFLNEISKNNISDITDIKYVYNDFYNFFTDVKPWDCKDINKFGDILKQQTLKANKYRELSLLLFDAPKVPKTTADDNFPYNRECILKGICGNKISAKQLFNNDNYDQIDLFTLDKSDDELAPILTMLDDNAALIIKMKSLYDWAILNDVLQGETYISKSKINIYEQHHKDLKTVKYFIKKYCSDDDYKSMFHSNECKNNYIQYAKEKKATQEDFCKFIKKMIGNISPDDGDKEMFDTVMQKINSIKLCPKQVNSSNRVIPYQVYWIELNKILNNASTYLPFLNSKENGISVSEKILSIFEFRVPYFVGPINSSSKFAWIQRKDKTGKIYPWNFNEKVDLEASEQAFIDRMTNSCTYFPFANVIPKMSLCYEKFQLLNEINPITVNNKRISPEIKKKLFCKLFAVRKKVSRKAITDFLLSNNYYTKEEVETLSGIDVTIKSSLYSHISFDKLLKSGTLSENDVERIIERRTYTENKSRFVTWLSREYPNLSESDSKYISSLKFKDFGRLSKELLCDIYGTKTNTETGEACSIIERMWNENLTLMEVLSDDYTYSEQINSLRKEYFDTHKLTLNEKLDDMCISNSVKRPIIRTLDIISDIVKAKGCEPKKIFIEMSRGGTPEQKGIRTKSRYSQILELYEKCDTEDVRRLLKELEAMGDNAERNLQSDKLFLYYMQLGRCMYSEEPIVLSKLSDSTYNIDHIYPQSKVKDDSILNNKVLVLSTINGDKDNVIPIKSEVRTARQPFWKYLKEHNFITDEKYNRLTRNTPFSENEKWGFINRQLTETRQSTKAIATILNELYPKAQIVYVKAGMVSEFRQEFDMLKSRSVNDLHHAKDAYLNIVVGNVYNERFTKQWFLKNIDTYNLKIKNLFTHPVTLANGTVIWEGENALKNVKKVVQSKNAIHCTRYAFCRKGGFFDQNPRPASNSLTPLKKNLPTEKYGGYQKSTATYFLLVKYTIGKKNEFMIMPVELLIANKLDNNPKLTEEYAINTISSIKNKIVSAVSFPLGFRKIKLNTVFEFDNTYRAYLTGKASGARQIILSTFMSLNVGYKWEKYIKHIERFIEKKASNPNMIYSEFYDKVNIDKNIELYDILTEKLSTKPYCKQPANQIKTLENGRDIFINLDIFEQSKCLLQILTLFSRVNGSDLSAVKGAPKAGTVLLSSDISNWKKNYTDVRIVDMSSSGLFTKKSENLLDLL